jgi:hypothetical protein
MQIENETTIGELHKLLRQDYTSLAISWSKKHGYGVTLWNGAQQTSYRHEHLCVAMSQAINGADHGR